MARTVIAFFGLVGATALTVWLETLDFPGWLLLLVAVLCYGIVAVGAWWPRWKAAWKAFAKSSGSEASGDEGARELLMLFNKEANEAIVKLRDEQGNAVNEDLVRFRNFAISVGRWAGRMEYLAGQLRNAFPNEVSAFEVYGGDDIQYEVPTGFPITTLTKHLQATITVKVKRLRELTAAMQNALHRK